MSDDGTIEIPGPINEFASSRASDNVWPTVRSAMFPVTTVEKQGSRFQKGRSGNPNGRPKGSRNAATLAVEALLDGQAEALTRKAIEMALDGDAIALRLCLDRIYPRAKRSTSDVRLAAYHDRAGRRRPYGIHYESGGQRPYHPQRSG